HHSSLITHHSFAGGLLSGLAVLLVVVAVGLGVAAVQLLPLYELSTFSFRGQAVSHEFATSFAPPPQNLLTLLFPYFFRDPAGTYTSPFFRNPSGAYWSPWFRWDTTAYGGIAPLILAMLALTLAVVSMGGRAIALFRRASRAVAGVQPAADRPVVASRWVIFFAGVFGVAVLLALADSSPINLYALIRQLPVFWSTRVPARYLYLALFALAMLAGFGLQSITRVLDDRRHRSGPLLHALRRSLVVLTVAGLALPVVFWQVREWAAMNRDAASSLLLAPYLAHRGRNVEIPAVQDPFGAFLTSLDPFSRWTEQSFTWLGLSLLLLLVWCLVRRHGAVFRVGLVLLAAADLVLFARDFHPRVPIERTMNDGPAVQFLVEHNGLHRVASLWPVWETWPNKLLPWKVAEANGYSSLLPSRHIAYMNEATRLDNRLYDVMGVKYVVVHRARIPPRLQAERPVFEDHEVAIYERPTALPRAFVVGKATLTSGQTEALREMTRFDFDPLRRAVVEDPAALACLAGGSEAAPGGSAEVVSYAGERVEVRARADRPSLLFLSDRHYPGWRAYVDGEERPIYQADVLFRAVPLPPGDHTIVFVFDPTSVKVGALLSALTLLAVGAGLLATVPGARRWRSVQKC
ncbi:MAG: YfhO family protein, partial [Chloroflexi bacterium]|nr:YfhO family protein [Chloroflexota bacterium]